MIIDDHTDVGRPFQVKSVTDGREGDSPNGTAQAAQPLTVQCTQRL